MATPAPVTTQTPATASPAVNTNLFAQPGESFSQYEARVSGGNSGNAQPASSPAAAPVTTTAAPASGSVDDAGVSASQYQLQPGETTDAYNARVAGLRAAGGEPTPATNPTDITSAEDQLAQSLGYKSYADAQSQLSANPTQSETDLYNSAYSAAGLDDLNNQIESRKNDLNTAAGNINDNPWLDESTRVGRTKSLTDLANADIKNMQDNYNTKLKSVQDLVTRETADQSNTSKANTAKLTNLEAQAKAIAAQNVAAAKTAAAAPKTIKGSTTGATYQWNPSTQTFDPIIAATPKTSSAGGGKAPVPAASTTGTGAQFANFNFTATQLGKLNAAGLPQDHANTILQEIKQGYTLDDIRQQMTASGLNPGLLDTVMLYVDPAHNTPAPAPKKSSSTSSRTL